MLQTNGVILAKSIGTAEIIAKNKEEDVQVKCKVTVKEISEDIILEIDESLKVEADEISGLDINNSTVGSIKNLIKTNLKIEIYSNEDKLLKDGEQIGTGSKLILKDENNNDNEVFRYVFVVYGDVNGDGLINSLDVLVLQKHILESKLLTGIFLKSGNISKNGNPPSSLDVLKIQKHILETKFIEQ